MAFFIPGSPHKRVFLRKNEKILGGQKMKNVILVCLLVFLFVMASPAFSETYYVDGMCGDDSWSGLDPNCYEPNGPKESIQAAINAASTGDTVIVSPYEYFENVNFSGKDIVLTSQYPNGPNDPNGSAIVANTIINGAVNGPVVTFSGDESELCQLKGFAITNGSSFGNGGGIAGNHTHATVSHCVIHHNSADGYGGGLADCDGPTTDCVIAYNGANDGGGGFYGCNGAITNCVITKNFSDNGAGGGLLDCNGAITRCTISNNSASVSGGGLGGCMGTISYCTICDNISGGTGGGLNGCHNGLIDSCIICRNQARYGGGLNRCYNTTIRNCLISENSSSPYHGGGVRICYPTLRGCTVSNNWSNREGGGVIEISGTIENCIINNNTANNSGGGLYNCSAELTDCLIKDNRAENYDGGGLRGQTGDLRNCCVAGNRANRWGGGMAEFNASMRNCTVIGNLAGEKGGGIYASQEGVNMTIYNSILWNNDALGGQEICLDDLVSGSSICVVNWCDCFGGQTRVYVGPSWTLSWGGHNIDAPGDELFCDPGYWLPDDQWVHGDIHLAPNSPAIDTGNDLGVPSDVVVDIDGDPRIIDVVPDTQIDADMGVDEFNSVLVRPAPGWLELTAKPACVGGQTGFIIKASPATFCIIDVNAPVEYIFESPAGAHQAASSGWQSSNEFLATDLIAGTYYSFRVKARNGNQPEAETNWSEMILGWSGFADFDGNKQVNFGDFARFSQRWLNDDCGGPSWCSGADIDQSGEVNFTDFSLFSFHWLQDFLTETGL
jgi:hypothetical protein